MDLHEAFLIFYEREIEKMWKVPVVVFKRRKRADEYTNFRN
ncbi:hypothetical protein SBF1_9570002 [Candidatus Desulfosporosinus infrequens]|uniref:Uncharacterized protein n=1 Tax=Candidatus Desulfosporosinus infrequens TaxID=2043169 RepID=A0A2U3LYF6_9FIRM|nr:hypothetical protein SBF1_9570002 [Candidatus Desulfosporosinus infrequens]